MSIQDIARQGRAEGSKLRWKFWQRAALNNQAMDQALLGIEQQAEPRLAHGVRFARELGRQSPNPGPVYQQALEALSQQVSAELAPMAGFALAVARRSDAPREVKTKLEAELLERMEGGGLARLPAPPEPVLALLEQAPATTRELADGLAPLLNEQTARPALELLGEKAPDWKALHDQLPLQGLEAARALVSTIGNGPAPTAAAWALQLCQKGHDLAAWGLEQNRTPESAWHRWNDEWDGRRPLAMLEGSLSGNEPTREDRLRLTREELTRGEPAELLEWLNQTAPGPEAELARDLAALPLADESARTALLQAALDGKAGLSDQVHTLRDKLRLLHGELAGLEGPFQGVAEELLKKPWQQQAVTLWTALEGMRALPNPTPVERARCLADADPELDGLLWRNLAPPGWVAPPDRRQAWETLEELRGSLGYQVVTLENQPLVRENSGSVDIGPVRLPKRDSSSRAGETLTLESAAEKERVNVFRNDALEACPATPCKGPIGAWLFDQAVAAGRKLEGGSSKKNRSMYTIAAAVAGERAGLIGQEARSGERGSSSQNRSLYALAAAQAGSPEAATRAFQLARSLEGGSNGANRAIWTQAAALAGSPERGQEVKAMARRLEGGHSARDRAVYAIACAIAGERAPEALATARKHEGGSSRETRGVYFIATAIAGPRADAAYAEARSYEGGRNRKTRGLYFVAAAVAGSPEISRLAFQLARQAEGGASSENRAYYAIAAAAALNPSKRHLAAAVFFPEKST